jgi:hypothetical protein
MLNGVFKMVVGCGLSNSSHFGNFSDLILIASFFILCRLLCLLACADDEILPSFKYVNTSKCVVKIDSIFIKHLRYAEWTLVNPAF